MSGRDYEVGKGRPPVATRFKKGQPPPKGAGRPRAEAVHVIDFFDEPLVVPVNGRRTKMEGFEVVLTNVANRAIGGDMRAARRFLEFCISAGLLVGDTRGEDTHCYRVNTFVWDKDEWLDNYDRLGPPPWSGKRNGLFNENWREEALWRE